MRINNLPNWCIPDSSPAFYDTDSKSVLDQTAKLYGIIKKLVADYNDYAKEIDTGMDDLESEVKKLQTELEERITKLIHDYIRMLDDKVKNQDLVIEENIVYIKNNISNEVIRIVNEMKENGELEAIIGDSLEGLTTKINEIESQVFSINNSINALSLDISKNVNDIDTLEEKINKIGCEYNLDEESLIINFGGEN